MVFAGAGAGKLAGTSEMVAMYPATDGGPRPEVGVTVIDDYLRTLEPPQRLELQRVRQVALHAAPDADEVISYGMPTLDLHGKHLIHFACYKNHMSIFPGTIRFTPQTPVAEDVIRGIVEKRLTEIAAD